MTAILCLTVAASLAQTVSNVEISSAEPASVQRAVEKGLFFVEHQSMRWWKTKKCATCHEGQILLVAANVAKSQNVPVDQEKLDFWTERWVLTDALVDYKDGRLNGLGIPTAPFVLLHRDLSRDSSAERSKKWAEVLRIAFQTQSADGSWTPRAAIVDITPRMALALADLEESKIPFADELRQEITERRKRTEEWIKAREPQKPEKSESLAGWVTYEHQRGEPQRAKILLDELLSRRREDGGWGIKKEDPSHLLVTSVVLLALKTSGFPNDNPVVAETQRYLLSKQSEDGRWHELGRHFHPEAYHTAYDAWTTGYAVAALSLTLPKLPPDAKRLFTPDPKLVAEVEQLTKSAADGYQGQADRTGDPTQREPFQESSKAPADPAPGKELNETKP
ncbi:hypothetical protein AYO47_00250 [Planctomyces sp. SCGC AG-212-M04]|nr:hypothetical protein AYO47_00250 [Planctomyces sp. SCGC AG-212-M04]